MTGEVDDLLLMVPGVLADPDIAFLDSRKELPRRSGIDGVDFAIHQTSAVDDVDPLGSAHQLHTGPQGRDPRHAHPAEQVRIISSQAFRLRPKRLGPLHELPRQPATAQSIEDTDSDLRIERQGLEFVEVLADRSRRGAVVASEEVVEQRLHGLVRVPEELGDEPRPQFPKLRVGRLIGALLEEPHNAIVSEEPNVARDRREVRVWPDVVVEVGRVVPDVELVRDRRPAADVFHEPYVLGIRALIQGQ